MSTELEPIAEKARREPTLRFTSLAHHLTVERLWRALHHIPSKTAPGTDGITQPEAVSTFDTWAQPMLNAVHRQGYRPPTVRRVWIPKPGKVAKRPLGIPAVADRALQRSTAEILSAIWEQDFLPVSFGGRPGRSAHHALATLNEVIAGKRVSWVLEADLKNFFGSLDHTWMMQFVEHRIGDPRILRLIRRWLKVGVLDAGEVQPSREGTPQGGSISVLLSNLYLHYVLDLWFEKAVKPHLEGEAYLIRYLDDFVVCFEHQRDAQRFYAVLSRRLSKFHLELEPTKTRLIAFGRFAQRDAQRQGRKKPETLYFLGFTHYCTRNRQGGFKIGRRTEKSRVQRTIHHLQETMRGIRHDPLEDQVEVINQLLQGHYAYFGMAGNLASLLRVYRSTQWYWRRMLSSRSQKSTVTWPTFQRIQTHFPLRRPKVYIPYEALQRYAIW
jgi:group II intron reverse transcriptase/maturase